MLEFLITQRRKSVSCNVEALRCGLADLWTRHVTWAGRHNLGDRQLPTANHDLFPPLNLLEQA